MPLNLAYYSTTKPDSLSAAMTTSATQVSLTDGSSYPDPAAGGNGPYTIIIGYGSSREEVCTVTAKPTANTLTVQRAQDGTAATAKNVGDVVVHGVSARDFKEIAAALPKTGGTLTGALTLSGAPTSTLHAATKKYVDDSVAASPAVPIGAIVAFGGTAAPAGWHLCDGSVHGSSALQAVLGSTTTPDLRSRFIVGAGQGTGLSAYADKAVGGAEGVTLTAAQSGSPAHSHTASSASASAAHSHSASTDTQGSHSHGGATQSMNRNNPHAHGIGSSTVLGSFNGTNQDGDISYRSSPTKYASLLVTASGTYATDINHEHGITADGGHTHAVTVASADPAHSHGVTVAASTAAAASQSHENRPPYYALTYIIRKA